MNDEERRCGGSSPARGFVVGITIFTGININASRTEFREHLTGLGNEFRANLKEQTDRFKELDKQNREQTNELKATAVSLNDFKKSMEKDFNDMKAEFEKMRDQFKPAKDISKEIINGVHAEFEKPEALRHETLRQMILLLLGNPDLTEDYRLQLNNELQRLQGGESTKS